MPTDRDGPGGDSTPVSPVEAVAAREERESAYPEEGFALVEIDYTAPLGEALTVLERYDSLREASVPPDTDQRGYVLYDHVGVAYRREDLANP